MCAHARRRMPDRLRHRTRLRLKAVTCDHARGRIENKGPQSRFDVEGAKREYVRQSKKTYDARAKHEGYAWVRARARADEFGIVRNAF